MSHVLCGALFTTKVRNERRFNPGYLDWPADLGGLHSAGRGLGCAVSRVYISGPMTGLPDFNHQSFHNKAAELMLAGRNVVNPALNGQPFDATWAEHMRADIRLLMDCDTIHMLPGWSNSKGARLEWWIAMELGMTVEGAEK